MEIRKSKNHVLFNCLTIFSGCLVVYIIVSHEEKFDWRSSIDGILVMGLGFVGLYRLYYLDVYSKLVKKETPVDFWIFYNELLKDEMVLGLLKQFVVRPYFKTETEIEKRKALKKVNYSSYLTYFLIVCLILHLIYMR